MSQQLNFIYNDNSPNIIIDIPETIHFSYILKEGKYKKVFLEQIIDTSYNNFLKELYEKISTNNLFNIQYIVNNVIINELIATEQEFIKTYTISNSSNGVVALSSNIKEAVEFILEVE